MVERGRSDHNNLRVDDNIFEQQQEFKYLNITLSCQNMTHDGVINIS